jgi:CMP-N-acetylneuraminic acid synthetase
MNALIIPCRKGSKSIRDKNLTRLRGKTLVRIVLEKAIESNVFDHIVISTDYSKAQLGISDLNHKRSKVQVLDRPAELCTDDALMKDVIKHAIDKVIGKGHKWVWLMQPTSPFTEVNDLVNMSKILRNSDKDFERPIRSLITFKPVAEHSNRMFTLKDNEDFTEAFPLRFVSYANKQDLPAHYLRSGNMYVLNHDEFIKDSLCGGQRDRL